MRYKVISCNVFKRELEYLAKYSPHTLEIEYLELGEHARPNVLRKKLQQKIDETIGKKYDAILLGYGLCGLSTSSLEAKDTPLVIPRSHDCCAILLGSRKRFEELFSSMPSTPFSSIGYIENGEYFFTDGGLTHGDSYANMVEQYGEDDAKYIWDAMHPKLDGELQPVYFISHDEIPYDKEFAIFQAKTKAENRESKHLTGSLSLLMKLLGGEHSNDEFLTVNPGQKIKQVGDWDKIITID